MKLEEKQGVLQIVANMTKRHNVMCQVIRQLAEAAQVLDYSFVTALDAAIPVEEPVKESAKQPDKSGGK